MPVLSLDYYFPANEQKNYDVKIANVKIKKVVWCILNTYSELKK